MATGVSQVTPPRAPHLGQLRTGEWCVFNAEGTPLWQMTFPTRAIAARAMAKFFVEAKLSAPK